MKSAVLKEGIEAAPMPGRPIPGRPHPGGPGAVIFAPPPALEARVRAELARSRPPRAAGGLLASRGLRAALALALGLAVLPLVLVVRSSLDGRPIVRGDVAALADAGGLLRLCVLVALAVVATGAVLRSGRAGLGLRAPAQAAVLAGAALAYAVTSLAWPLDAGAATHAAAAGLTVSGYPCATIAATVGGAELALLVALRAHAVPVAVKLRGALAGVAAGLWAGVALLVHCPGHELVHVAFGHVLPVAVLAGAGLLVARSKLRA